MPAVNIIDELFIVASPETVRAFVCDPARWAGWLPDVSLASYDDRGLLGVRWKVSGELTGTAEVWLEEHGDGTIVHAYLRADLTRADPPGVNRRSANRHRQARSRRFAESRYILPLKRGLFAAKDLLEGDREPGIARVAISERVVSASEDSQEDRRPRAGRPRSRRSTGTGSEGAAPDGRPDHLQHRDRR